METVIQDHTPLADYLKGWYPSFPYFAKFRHPSRVPYWSRLTHPLMADEGEEAQQAWATPSGSDDHDESPPSSPSFAPVGRPMVRKRFRNKLPDQLPLDVPRMDRLSSLRHSYSVRCLNGALAPRFGCPRLTIWCFAYLQKAVASRIDRADNHKFIEQFRYTIVASQLLSGHSITGQHPYSSQQKDTPESQDVAAPTSTGLLVTAAAALVVAWVVRWVYTGGYVHLTKKRVGFTAIMLVAVASVSHVYIRQQWLRYLKNQALAEVKSFVAKSQDFDSASSAALSLIQEVELVSRGYRM